MGHAGDAFTECIICYDTLARSARVEQKCSHDVCAACFAQHLRATINDDCNGFPRCPHSDCVVAASDTLISRYADEQTTARMRYLRGVRPTRREDGRRMWCVVPGCYEPLPPPVVGQNDRSRHPNSDDAHPLTTECPKCAARLCMRCGAAEHSHPCRIPESGRALELYQQHTVTRVTECQHCGVHAELTSGNDKATCARCLRTSTFRLYNNKARDFDNQSVMSSMSSTKSKRPDRNTGMIHEPNIDPDSRRSLNSTRNRYEEAARVAVRSRIARHDKERISRATVSRGSSYYGSSTTSSPEKPSNRLTVVESSARLSGVSSAESTYSTGGGDEFGILARIDDLRANRHSLRRDSIDYSGNSPSTARLRRFISNPTDDGANGMSPKTEQVTPSIFDGDFKLRSDRRASFNYSQKRLSGSIRRIVGKMIERDATIPANHGVNGPPPSQIRPRTRRSLDFESSPITNHGADDGPIPRRRSAYIPKSYAPSMRSDDYFERRSVGQRCE